eukprot:TRINITY_DN1942_c0_g1_i2.p1 TRINITY_DN1942_c0_g1~~TRINITY_DN1942_c0_g1_i2.p1  ORF type:complete len:305 (-),score=35.48 TRINITY_DN1942_c0_g1_i2:4-795(-)
MKARKIQFHKKPRYLAHKLDNCEIALGILRRDGLKVDITPMHLVDANRRMILGLLWVLILRWHPPCTPRHDSPKYLLMKWVKERITPYALGKPITSFRTDFCDGRVLYALADSLAPGCLTSSCLSGLSNDPIIDLQKVFDLNEKKFGIPQILDPEDLDPDCADELSVITYISYMRDYQSSRQAKHDQDLRTAAEVVLRALWPTCGMLGVFDGLPEEIQRMILHFVSDGLLSPQQLSSIHTFSRSRMITTTDKLSFFFFVFHEL